MTSNNLRELAKQGDPKVISSIINHSLQKKGINVQVTKDNDSLEVTLESDQVSNQQASLVEFIRTGIVKLGVESINTVKVYGVQTGDDTPVWEEEFFLGTPPTTHTSELEEESEPEDFPETVDDLDEELETVYETETDEDYYEEGEYDEEEEYEDDDEELSQEPQSSKKKIPFIPAILLGCLLVAVAAPAILHFSGIFPLPFLSQSNSENTESNDVNSSDVNSSTPETSPQDSQTSESPKTPESSTTADSNPWYFAVKSAQSAAQKAKTATTKSEWNAVASDWQKAVDLMKKVPESNPNYQTAQMKVLEYQNYLDIAKQRADQAPN
ncbi:MAG: hypothetical protein F6K22_17355 [Okeania sp. SIO2F4]|uniref:hypothetical protein n=1 Tax=Okeania sp. SIO2F4 TaxID=2607790 RepID=UPI001429FDAE|nr:hypothetical protein [Okeania sp. SIO2F4]NES04441.1 hypothetical protein [Okeania sp. SIO2F4]